MRQVWITTCLALALLGLAAPMAHAQDKPGKDDTLEGLLEDLEKTPEQKARPSDAQKPKAQEAQKGKPPAQSKPGTGGASGARAAKPLPAGDQELDSLLEKLGETKDEPEAAGAKAPAGGQAPPRPQPKKDSLGGDDKKLDERLEELTGRRRKKQQGDPPASGAAGEMIKEMREVERRLGQPDTGETTRTREKAIVKRIDELIEQTRKQGGMQGRMAMRGSRPGERPGDQQGQEPGAQGRGVGPQKPARPTTTHVKAGGKDIWGHLPPELRAIMENTFKETELPAKAEMISRYFLSVTKGRLTRED